MLCLTRQDGQAIVLTTASGERIVVQVVKVRRGKFVAVKLGVECDRSVTIDRLEVDAAKRMGLSAEQAKSLRVEYRKDSE